MFKKAFTFLEAVIVIILMAILSAVFIPKYDKNNLRQAANQILSHIRYARHLALVDEKFDPYDQYWYRKRWQIRFFKSSRASRDGTSKWAYAVFSDKPSPSYNGYPEISNQEVAKDPLDQTYITGGYSSDPISYNYNSEFVNKKAAIEETYGIVNVVFSSSCSYYNSKSIIFDYLGRPLRGRSSSYNAPYERQRMITSVCKITFFDSNNNSIKICIEPETGHSYICQ